MLGKLYLVAVAASVVVFAILVLLSIIRRLTAGKMLIERCRQLVVSGSYVTGKYIDKKMTDKPSKNDKDDPYRWLVTYEYTVNGRVYTTKKEYTSKRRNREFPEDPKIYFEPDSPDKGYVEAEPDVYTGEHAGRTVIKALLLLGLYLVMTILFIPSLLQ